MKLFLGVDGGQSSTTALIGDENGRALGAGVAGPSNHAGTAEGRSKLESAVSESLAGACSQAGLQAESVQFDVACFGMSGGPSAKQSIVAGILRARRMLITTDAAIALSGATGGGPGIITIAGTGSMALGRNVERREARAGGWGYVFGDEGGAFDIARQGARAALRMEEGWGSPTGLRAALLEATGAADANEMLHRFYTSEWPRARVAELAQVVDALALTGDSVAQTILHQAAQQLAMLTASVREQLWKPGDMVTTAYAGGVFRSRILLERYRWLVELTEKNRCAAPQYPPVAGALLEAYHTAGLNPAISGLPHVRM
jgi:N-acetylglucosamine kinase-like BadF-type ATPase